jgi:hypothetical protein
MVSHFIFALMIALLPLRGWMGDAMATQMAVQAVQVAQTAQGAQTTPARHSTSVEATPAMQPALHGAPAAAMPADCLSHGSVDASEADEAGTTPLGAHCENCSACQACHTVALSPSTAQHSAAALRITHPASGLTRFASFDAASGQKPPIF